MKAWYVYMLHCADNSVYTGVALDVEARVEKHNSGKGAKYTRGRLPVRVVYREQLDSHGAALKRERALKKLRPLEKQQLIASAAK